MSMWAYSGRLQSVLYAATIATGASAVIFPYGAALASFLSVALSVHASKGKYLWFPVGSVRNSYSLVVPIIPNLRTTAREYLS